MRGGKGGAVAAAALAAAVALGGAVALNNSGSKGLGRTPSSGAQPPAAPTDTSTARVPHNDIAYIFNLFGAVSSEVTTMAELQRDLEDESYRVTLFADVTEGEGSQGGGTLTNFIKMAQDASVIIVNGHGFDFSGTKQPGSCPAGKGITRCDASPEEAPADPTPVTPIPGHNFETQAGLQVEWYPTWEEEKAGYQKYLDQGMDPNWLIDPSSDAWAGTLLGPRAGDKSLTRTTDSQTPDSQTTDSQASDTASSDVSPTALGYRPWLGISAAGIAHFFQNSRLDLVDVLNCHSMALASSFASRSYFGHTNQACSGFEQVDEPLLFDRLIGKSGVPPRSTTEAMAEGGFQDKFFGLSPDSKPVVLSPAVESVSPQEGSRVAPNSTTSAEVRFDAEMDTSDTNDVVTVSGCGASVQNLKWPDSNQLTFDIKVPANPSDTTLTVTVHKDRAQASPGDSPNQELDGNSDPSGSSSGLAPNRDDYTYRLSCSDSSSSTFKMVYSGTYEFNYLQSGPNQAPTTETGSYTWTQTQTVTVSSTSNGMSESVSTTTLDASGKATIDGPNLNVSCTIQTPPNYQWVAKSPSAQVSATGDTPLTFSWSISSPPMPGTPEVTASPGSGPPSGCQSNILGFVAELGLPEPSAGGEQSTLDPSQSQTFQDAEVGSVSGTSNQLPTTKHFDIDAQKSTTEDTITNAGTMKFHGTLTFSRVS